MTESGYAIVEREKCFSYAICVDMMPEVFHLDDEGISVASVETVAPLSTLIEAAENCPMQAITVFPSDVPRMRDSR